jgi:hypothetical protein
VSASTTPSIADLLEATNRELAGSDARLYRRLGTHLQRTARSLEELNGSGAQPPAEALALPGRGSFRQQSVSALRALCRAHGIRGFSRLKKAELAGVLERHGVEPPPPPLESYTKKELIALVRQLLAGA